MKKARRTVARSLKEELAALARLPDEAIDTGDIPEVRDWRGAERGRFYRPIKKLVTIRLDADVLAWFKQRDARDQTAVNRALREYMASHAAAGARGRSRAHPPAARRASRG